MKLNISLLKLALAVLISALALSSCTNEAEENESQELPDHYSYTVTLSCFCWPRGPFDIEIKDDEIVSFQFDEDIEIPDTDEFMSGFTISALSARVEELQSQDPVREDITLHPVYKFPMDVYIDLDEQIADEEWGYIIENFEEL